MINSIGPVWDGNEVWLVTGGGALFAAFPGVYATAFSGFYIALMFLLFALIFRAAAIEFRGKRESRRWRQIWDISFSISSILSALLIGIALGNIAYGVPLTAEHEYMGHLIGLLRPYPIIVGITTVALFMMHASIYVVLKTEGELQARVREWVRNTIIFFVITYIMTTMLTLIYVPHMKDMLVNNPVLFIVPFLNILAIANIPREVYHGRDFRAFLSSSVSVLLLLALFGIGMYPDMIFSRPNPEHSLTIYNASSSHTTLEIMLIIAAIGMPLVLAYTTSIYWVFRGKVKLDSSSY
jgi:cytochrome d ubiquinol oxidase subunit II